MQGPPTKKQRVVADTPLEWPDYGGHSLPMEVIGDDQLVINWLNGIASVKCPWYVSRCSEMVNGIFHSWRSGYLSPHTATGDWYRHLYRELNQEADAFAPIRPWMKDSRASGPGLGHFCDLSACVGGLMVADAVTVLPPADGSSRPPMISHQGRHGPPLPGQVFCCLVAQPLWMLS